METLLTLKVDKPEQALFKSAERALANARIFDIDSVEARDLAAQDLTKIKGLQKDLEEKRMGITRPIDDAKKAVMDLFRPATQFLEEAETVLKGAIRTFDIEETRKRIAEQAKLEEAARKERARLAAAAAATAAAARADADKIAEQAAEATQAGNFEEAARLHSEAVSRIDQGEAEAEMLAQTSTLITAPMAPAMKRTKGVSTRKVWKTEVVDMLTLVKWVAAHPDYLNLLEANMPAINKIGLALKEACPIEGIRVFEDDVIAARRA